MKHYRKIWEDTYGKIPIDEHGRTYEIHHINGDHNDNRLENLECLSIVEHYQRHYDQGDYGACTKILYRMTEDAHQKSKMISHHNTMMNNEKVKNGTHPFLSNNRTFIPTGPSKERNSELRSLEVVLGTHSFTKKNRKGKMGNEHDSESAIKNNTARSNREIVHKIRELQKIHNVELGKGWYLKNENKLNVIYQELSTM